jgi:hypothetical protein
MLGSRLGRQNKAKMIPTLPLKVNAAAKILSLFYSSSQFSSIIGGRLKRIFETGISPLNRSCLRRFTVFTAKQPQQDLLS